MAAVYDDEKTKTPGSHDDLGVHPEHKEAEVNDLENLYNAPSAQNDNILDQEKAAAEGRPSKKSTDTNPVKKDGKKNSDGGLYNANGDEANKAGLRGRLAAASKKRKLLLAAAGGGGIAGIIIILLIVLLLGSLIIPNFMASVTAYQFARVTRETVATESEDVTEKAAIDSAPDSAYTQLKNQFKDLRDNTWGKLDAIRPAKIAQTYKTDSKISYQYGKPSKLLHRSQITKVIVEGEAIDIPQNAFSTLQKILNPIEYTKAVFKSNAALKAAVGDMVRADNHGFIVRSLTMKSIRADLDAELFRWTPAEEKENANKPEELAKEVATEESYKVATDNGTAAAKAGAGGAESDDIEETAQQAAQEQNACYTDPTCTEAAIKSGSQLAPDAVKTIESGVGDSTFKKILGFVSPTYAIAVPICLVLDGSVVNSQGTIDTNTQESERTYINVAAAADQIKSKGVPGSETGGLAAQMGDVANTIPQQRASGLPVNTSQAFSPEAGAGGTYQMNLLNVIFPNVVGDVLATTFGKICPALTNPGVGALMAGLNLIPGVAEGLDAAGEVTAQTVAKVTATELGNVIKNIFAKQSLKRITIETVATVGAALLARMIVMQHMGAVNDGSAQGQSYDEEIDMGGNLLAQQVDKMQNFGRPLNNTETSQVKTADVAYMQQQTQEQNTFQRYFNVENPGSLMNNLAVTVGTHMNAQGFSSLISSMPNIFNPGFLFSKMADIIKPASAAAASNVDTSDYGDVQWGWSTSEENTFETDPNYQMLQNQQVLDASGKEDEIASKYGKCFTQSDGELLSNGDIQRDANGDILSGADDGDCSPTNLGITNPTYGDLVFRYRVAQRHLKDLDEIANQQSVGQQNT